MDPQWVIAIGTSVAAVAAGVGVAIAWRQLSKLNKSIRTASLANIRQLEAEMNARKARVNEIACDIRRAGLEETPNVELIEILDDEMGGLIENWLNASDRLAYCILHKYWIERDWRAEYRPYMQDLVDSYPDKFGPNTRYTNILDLHSKWVRE